jgi:Conjugal transfer protein
MKTVPFLVFAFFSLSAQAEPPAPPQQSVAPAATAATPEATASPAVQPSPGATPSVKGSAEPTASASKFDSGLLGGNNPVLTEEERAGVAITQAWRDKSYETLVGQPGSNSSVQFRFGQSLPSIVCAILQVTDIELQPGEAVTHINLGDSTRWSVESALSGSGADQVEHLIIKPRDIGLSTSLVVTTDRRTYHLLLRRVYLLWQKNSDRSRCDAGKPGTGRRRRKAPSNCGFDPIRPRNVIANCLTEFSRVWAYNPRVGAP